MIRFDKTFAVGISGVIWLIWYLPQKGLAGLNLDVVNFIFLIIGVLLHWTPGAPCFR